MPSYIDFLSVFTVDIRRKVEAIELRFSGFRERVLLSKLARGLELDHLALSGRNYQLCYNLKCVALKEGGPRIPKLAQWLWSARQGSFHHQFDLKEGTSSWIITSAREDLQDRVKELTGDEGRTEDKTFTNSATSFISSLAVHLLLAQWATEDWRGYIRWLEQVLEEKVCLTWELVLWRSINDARRFTQCTLVTLFLARRTFLSSRRNKTRPTKLL